MEITLEHMAHYTFWQLSEATQRHVTVIRVAWVLRHRLDYLASLTYKQKCLVSSSRIVEVVQRRMERAGMHLSKALIRLVLQAEELCYARLFAGEQALLEELFAEEEEANYWSQAA